jgi:hypothetical protein
MAGDSLELLGYFAGFWLFAFNREFRRTWIEEFRNASLLGKSWDAIEALWSVAIGVFLPIWLISLAVQQ